MLTFCVNIEGPYSETSSPLLFICSTKKANTNPKKFVVFCIQLYRGLEPNTHTVKDEPLLYKIKQYRITKSTRKWDYIHFNDKTIKPKINEIFKFLKEIFFKSCSSGILTNKWIFFLAIIFKLHHSSDFMLVYLWWVCFDLKLRSACVANLWSI